MAGLVWGCAGWIYFETAELLPLMLLVMIIAGMNAGAARSVAPVPVSYRVYVITTMTPLFFRFIMQPDATGWTLELSFVT